MLKFLDLALEESFIFFKTVGICRVLVLKLHVVHDAIRAAHHMPSHTLHSRDYNHLILTIDLLIVTYW